MKIKFAKNNHIAVSPVVINGNIENIPEFRSVWFVQKGNKLSAKLGETSLFSATLNPKEKANFKNLISSVLSKEQVFEHGAFEDEFLQNSSIDSERKIILNKELTAKNKNWSCLALLCSKEQETSKTLNVDSIVKMVFDRISVN